MDVPVMDSPLPDKLIPVESLVATWPKFHVKQTLTANGLLLNKG